MPELERRALYSTATHAHTHTWQHPWTRPTGVRRKAHEACTPPGVLSCEILRLPKPAAIWGVYREVQKYAIPAGHFDADLVIIFRGHFYILNFECSQGVGPPDQGENCIERTFAVMF